MNNTYTLNTIKANQHTGGGDGYYKNQQTLSIEGKWSIIVMLRRQKQLLYNNKLAFNFDNIAMNNFRVNLQLDVVVEL